MKAIIIGAGRGRRLMPLTDEVPKCYAEIGGRRILDWCLDALGSAGLEDTVFIGGYLIDRVRADYPHLRFVHNAGWESNNILLSLMHARAEMADGFVSSYADILYTPEAVQRLATSEADITLLVDTDWRARYRPRTQHPESDGEKVRLRAGRVVEVNRAIAAEEAPAEFTGVAKFSPAGARALVEHYDRERLRHDGRPYRGAPVFAKAYMIHLLQAMLEAGVEMAAVETPGGYFEIDTTEDYHLAQAGWRR
ncbi:MAG TPA: phosphocholine cytidylyltransferase family protein [Methylomirabilota bacterium]|nr:phosphocholine cytidylyltransferase family protein [Methylomirabilota bacterium]